MAMLKGRTIQLYVAGEATEDAFGVKHYTYSAENVENVLIGATTEAEALQDIQLYGKRSQYVLSIPSGDTHTWTDRIVGFYGSYWHTIGAASMYDPGALPNLSRLIPWNKKVRVVPYDGEVNLDD